MRMDVSYLISVKRLFGIDLVVSLSTSRNTIVLELSSILRVARNECASSVRFNTNSSNAGQSDGSPVVFTSFDRVVKVLLLSCG